MKKILFIIPFILLLAACGELQLEGTVSIDKQPETGGTTNPGSDGGETTNPGGDGDGGGTSTEPVFDYTKDPFKANLYYGRSLLTNIAGI